ncbi:conserved hypothetical protein [Candidatus Accumulibacter aalborgensis]|uniref:Uncharacterized protein n=1 Tax=Candidatus Accumulibacter aalborgensis TaxID=1860102 RepID=A0A1A8XSD6_9PROT|nr:2OG-Fe(II) oxygenase [Candidatus Accumulibacter aalborgensis]SBT08004.1 conserved hypothetical protein [Candidatus Accumulibacter aalborgensis]
MTTLTQDLADILKNVRRPGDFHATGRSEIFAPRLEVTGVGLVALPLLPAQAEQLVAVAEQAPYGRGSDTLIDTDVRRTWQIGADRVQIGGRHWDKDLANIVARSTTGLGVSEPVSAELYKLLVYDTGSFFVSHRDTEKAPGMFATLVVVMPSVYTGGELCIRHRDREVCLDLSSPEPSDVAFAAFYADCRHEIRPIISGCRLVLIYNLIRQGQGKLPEPPAYEAEVDRVSDLLQRWANEPPAAEEAPPEKLIYPLEHAYTPAEIGFPTLKGSDAAVASVLVPAAGRANCDLHLAFLAIRESGSAEYSGFSGSWSRSRRYSEPDDDDFEVLEVCDSSCTLSGWQTPDGSRPALAELPFDDEELCPPGALDDEEPDEQHFFEATGNEGASFERSYQRAALVLWPQAGKLKVIAGAGREVSLPYLVALTQRWVDSGEDKGSRSPLWNEAHQLARLMIARRDDWSTSGWMSASASGKAAPLLTALSQSEDTENIALFLAEVSSQGGYNAGDTEALTDAAMRLPASQAAALVERIITGNAAQQASACAEFLAAMAGRFLAQPAVAPSIALLEPAAQALVAALPGDPALAPAMEVWRRPLAVTPALVVDLLTALCHLRALAFGERAVDHMLAWPNPFALDAILVPAARRLAEQGGPARDWAPTRRLTTACLDHLAQRIAEPLVAPADFSRESRVDCRCAHCKELSAFLADPLRSVWTFKAVQADRSHVENSIRRYDCDIRHETLRRGSPHSLVCTKTQASFERRVAQRKKDLDDRERLSQATGQ